VEPSTSENTSQPPPLKHNTTENQPDFAAWLEDALLHLIYANFAIKTP